MKITKIDTIQVKGFPYLIFVQVHTDEGLIGVSDTYYATDAIAGYIHQWAAPLLLGKDPFQIERHWNTLYARNSARWGGVGGVEVRALSALDSALWDILGQALGVPIYQLLGGLAHDSIPTYNTCGGPMYGRSGSREGDGPDPLDDLWAAVNEPERLAEDLLSEGYTAMKIWPFDRYSLRGTGQYISAAEIEEGLEPIRRIRATVGNKIDIMIDGHGYWDLATAKKIARAVVAWLEELVLAHDIDSIAELKKSTTTPIIASEMLVSKYQYRLLMERRAADIIMIDPTWVGGITESRKVTTLAESFGLPVAMHDCTGPFTLMAGLHLALSAPNAIYQESVRAYIRTWYSELVPHSVEIVNGHILPPTAPGIGTYLLPEVFDREDATVVTSVL
jgi:L-alanine-DL-glutamate epimerase-like enolase superfamily enzyme